MGLRMTPNELSNRPWCFAARIGKVVDALPDTRLGRHGAGQLARSGASAPPNYDEARVGESRADFAHKINVALKELVEECDYIVDDFETDLLLTEVGMRLVERFSVGGGSVSVETTETEIEKFLAELREEFVWKIDRVAQPSILRGLARRLLPDYQELTPLTF